MINIPPTCGNSARKIILNYGRVYLWINISLKACDMCFYLTDDKCTVALRMSRKAWNEICTTYKRFLLVIWFGGMLNFGEHDTCNQFYSISCTKICAPTKMVSIKTGSQIIFFNNFISLLPILYFMCIPKYCKLRK